MVRSSSDLFAALAQVGEDGVDAVLVDGTQALGGDAQLHPAVLGSDPEAALVEVGHETAAGIVLRVRDVVAARRALAGDLADSGHKAPRWVAEDSAWGLSLARKAFGPAGAWGSTASARFGNGAAGCGGWARLAPESRFRKPAMPGFGGRQDTASRALSPKPGHWATGWPWSLGSGRGGLALGDEGADLLFQHRQRDRAQAQDGMVEGRQVEVVAQFRLGFATQLPDLQLAQLVAQGLGGPGDVAVDLGGDLVLGQGGVVAQEGQRLVAAPAQVMDAGVDHQAGGAPHFVGQAAEVLIRRLVDAHLLAQLLHVQAPAFAVGGDVAVAAEVGLLVLLAGQRGLEDRK